ncbi:OmpH family outer membrane protein [bacterium SCSIO 12741]|nr:OmpH family outer membrane protein [bacterium SCSIO 12741]
MKQILIVWNVVLTLLVGFLLWTMNSGSSPEPQEAEIPTEDTVAQVTPDTLPKFEGPIAFVNNDTLLNGYDFYQDSKQDLILANRRLEDKYKREVQKLENEYLELREKAPFMTQSQGEAAQQKLMARQNELMEMEQDLALESQKLEMEKLQEVKDRIADYLDRYKEEMGYEIVFGRSNLGGIHYANSRMDITQKVMVGLNEEYAKEKNPVQGDKK